MLSTSVLVVQRYFLAMGVGPAPTPLVARKLRCALERPIRRPAAYPPADRRETALQCPLLVSRGCISCFAPCSPVLLPRCGWRARIDPASGSCCPPRPQRTWALLSDALQRVLRQAGGGPLFRPLFHVVYNSPRALLRTSFLIPQRYFLDVDAGPVSAPPESRSLHRALSAHRHTVACSLLGQGEATPRCPLQVPRGYAPYLSPCSPAFLPRCGCQAHANTAGRPHTPRAPSTHGHFIRCTAACSPPSQWEAALQCPLQVPRGPAPGLVPHSQTLLPRCGCRARVGIASGPLIPSRP
ncbi:hypothetical protein NDU88_001663 [Pleurodeles waltl]|uniref:Uncharacterized protein n=1 Tax=Pleurodeles waltl TaxID=8319 RepID=A0AAV7LA45_PLEWA|nr:hypothetical protein NDU88_001663 [Pleurodeles waltl]